MGAPVAISTSVGITPLLTWGQEQSKTWKTPGSKVSKGAKVLSEPTLLFHWWLSVYGASLFPPLAPEEILPPPNPARLQGDRPVPIPEHSGVKSALCTLHNKLHGRRELAGAGIP